MVGKDYIRQWPITNIVIFLIGLHLSPWSGNYAHFKW